MSKPAVAPTKTTAITGSEDPGGAEQPDPRSRESDGEHRERRTQPGGCASFGAFTVKMLILPRRGLPGWVLPVVGALVFTLPVAIWFTSAFWFFPAFGIKR